MKKFWTCLLLAGLVLSSCVNVIPQTATSTPLLFVTSTLPPTRPGLSLLTATEMSSTLDPLTTTTPGTPAATTPASSSTESAGGSGACQDSAVMTEDVTIPDYTQITQGATFTKTWRFLNNGRCNWSGYTIAFFAGDRMGSADSAQVPPAEAGKTVDVSIELTAPSTDGSYTGFYILKNAQGETLPIGTEQSFWVKILVGNAVAAPLVTPSTSGGTPVPTVRVRGPASCNYSTSSSYANEIASLINNTRSENGLSSLNVNAQLSAAALGHSIDMACHNLLSHTGSDGSSVSQRVAAAGYPASYSSEIIYGSGYPQTAFDWWMSDPTHRNEILNPNVTDMGIGYAYNDQTSYGSYFTVSFGSP
ncbi:MAG TPA: NBR1-Ig-like domain-containing protein [Anaerolineales bacterium]|nr:NBR1-Ig-like domain-containing protein [Anaerolineales bacterium]